MSENETQSQDTAKTEASARSVVAYLQNQTKSEFTRKSESLAHGVWVTHPPAKIAPSNKGKWQSDSDGFMTGTEGSCIYTFQDGRTITCKVHWNNPYTGSNSYSIDVDSPAYQGSYTGGSGENATVYFSVAKIA
jgi:hypothetical protein